MPQLLSYEEKPLSQPGSAPGMIGWQASDLRWSEEFSGEIPLRVFSLMRRTSHCRCLSSVPWDSHPKALFVLRKAFYGPEHSSLRDVPFSLCFPHHLYQLWSMLSSPALQRRQSQWQWIRLGPFVSLSPSSWHSNTLWGSTVHSSLDLHGTTLNGHEQAGSNQRFQTDRQSWTAEEAVADRQRCPFYPHGVYT